MTNPDNALVPVDRYMSGRFEWAAPGDQQEDAWLLRFCDNDVGDRIWTGEDAEAEAWAAWNQHAPGYNCYLFRLAALRTAQPEPAYPKTVGRRHLGENRASGERLCSWGHDVPAGHPLYWPQQISQYDDSDPCCLEHAIEQYVADAGYGASTVDAIQPEPAQDEVERVARAINPRAWSKGGPAFEMMRDKAWRVATAAIAAMRPESERVGIVAWLRNPLTYVRGLSMAQCERLSDAIERGDHIKGNGDDEA